MRKEPIAIISTDKHLQEANALELLDIAEQEIALAQEQGVDTVIWLGDIFDSRLSQRQELLTCLTEMIELYHEHGITLLCIPGNHDKTDYESDESFLTAYKYHPGFNLYETPTCIDLKGLNATSCHSTHKTYGWRSSLNYLLRRIRYQFCSVIQPYRVLSTMTGRL